MSENSGQDVGDSEFSTGTVTLSPKTLQANTPISRQLLYTASEDVEALVRADLAKAHALAFDLAALHGTGQNNQPIGIYNAANVNVVAMGGLPTYGHLVDMITAIAVDNAIMGTVGWATNPRVAGKLLQTLVAQAAGSDMIWTGKIEDGIVLGYRAMASNQVSSTLGAGAEQGLVVGDFANVLIGQFGPGFELILDPYAKKKQGLVEFTSFQMGDVALRYPQAFCKATGLTLA
jgi:HK97 family phage major capsid protein